MSALKRRVLQWFEHRTGLETAVRNFLYEDIPASSGWHQVFGSIALFLFLVQVFTGILLAFNYAPTPGDAYNSLKFIITEVPAGRLIRGLHHWGASMMIVVVVLHMTQVFLYGAYKKPREATWMVGVVLLLVTLAYGLTGYLLPWDNRLIGERWSPHRSQSTLLLRALISLVSWVRMATSAWSLLPAFSACMF